LNVAKAFLSGVYFPTQVLNKNHFVDAAEGLNFSFSDNGLFGVRLTGSASHAKELLGEATGALKRLATSISEAHLKKAKNLLKFQIFSSL
jgi:predicted Zn-dependent peptidase